MDKQLIQRIASVLLLWSFAANPLMAQGILPGILLPVAAGGAPPTPVSAVHAPQGLIGISGCSGQSSCTYTLPYSPTSGNRVGLVMKVNHGNATLSITSLSGSGCPSSTAAFPVTTSAATANNAMGMWGWTGVAAGTGTCAVTVSAGGFFSNWDGASLEVANAIGVEAFGSAANNGASSLAITANAATTVAGDYAVVFWGANAASASAAATGYTSEFNASFFGAFSKASLSSGITLTFTGTPISNGSAENLGLMFVFKA